MMKRGWVRRQRLVATCTRLSIEMSSWRCHKCATCERYDVLLRQARREAVAAVYETQPMPDTVSKLPTTGITSDVA